MRIDRIIEKAERKKGFLDYVKGAENLEERQRIVNDFFSFEIGDSGTMKETIYFFMKEEFDIDLGGCPSFSYYNGQNPYCNQFQTLPRCQLEDEGCHRDDGMD